MGYKKIKIDGIISIGKNTTKDRISRRKYSQSRWKEVLKTVYLSPTLLGLSMKKSAKGR